MLSFEVFRDAMKPLGALLRFSQGHDASTMRAFYLAVKESFSDMEFQDVCLKYLQTNEDFPTPASFFKMKEHNQIPSSLDLYFIFQSTLNWSDRRPEIEYGQRENLKWVSQIKKYFKGKIPTDMLMRTEVEEEWLCKDWVQAYNSFVKDYRSGDSLMIDYDEIPAVNQRKNKTLPLKDLLSIENNDA